MSPDEIAQWVGADDFNKVGAMLARAFRAANEPQVLGRDAAAAAICSEWAARKSPQVSNERPVSALAFLRDAPAGWTPAAVGTAQQAYRYYDGVAVHRRSKNEVPHSAFRGILPMVRVPLPASSPGAAGIIAQTAIGTVFASDHLVPSVADIQARMNAQFGMAFGLVERVDVVTPARASGRFGAIALYLGYHVGHITPSFYVLEAGLATGAPVRLFPSPNLSAIAHAPTDYLPTPFDQLSNSYDGKLTLTGDEPTELLVHSFREPRRPEIGWRIEVRVMYEMRDALTVSKAAPGDLTLVAAERIAAIAETLGMRAIDLQGLLAPAGMQLPWIRQPRKPSV